jgi:hypothetical protein
LVASPFLLFSVGALFLPVGPQYSPILQGDQLVEGIKSEVSRGERINRARRYGEGPTAKGGEQGNNRE